MNQKTKATPKDRHFVRNSDEQTNSVRLTYGVLAVQKCTLPSYQPFGSIPRCCSSLRSMRFIQVANDESPSLRISSSSWVRKSSGSRIWYCGDFFNSCIDTCNYPYYYLNVITRVVTFELKGNAPKCSRTPRRLTTSDNTVSRQL